MNGPNRRIVFQLVDFFRDFLRLAFRQAGGGTVDEFPIGIEELPSAFSIIPIGQTLDQGPARGEEFSAAHSSPFVSQISWRAKFFANR